MHDSLYDSWVAAAYNALPDNPDIEPCLDGFYAPVYFSNLRSNFGTNRFGTCAFVAMGMLLSFYDTYWDDSIVPSAYEAVATSTGDPVNGSIDSPGSCDSLPLIGNSNASYYLNTIVPQNDGVYLDMKLMTLASYYMGFPGLDGNATGLDYSGMYSLFQYYLYSYMGFSTSDIGFIAETGTGTGQARSESVRDFAIEKVSEGIPVLLSVGTDYSQITGRHAVIAYDYDEGNDLLYCHMGWGPKATHVTIESFGYTSYNSAFSLAVRTQHSHTDNYKKVISGYCLSSHCACEFAAPYDIKNIDWYRNDEPGFEWSCLEKERWADGFIRFSVSSSGYTSENNLIEKRWKVPWLSIHTTSNQNTSIYDSQPISVIIHAEYEYDPFNLSSVTKTATFQAVTDFEGAHNIYPEDYGFSQTFPTTETDASHMLDDGFSFQTKRTAANVAYGRLNLSFAGGGHNEAYVDYIMGTGIKVMGIDFSVRYWDGTNSQHDFNIMVWNGADWIQCVDLLDYTYDIAGSDGAIRWVHHEFGTPVSKFRIHAQASNPSYYDSGLAGILSLSIFTDELPTSGYELPYCPCLWNNEPIIKNRSNCYRYALNFPSFENVQQYWDPGQYANLFYSGATKENLVYGALKDAASFKTNNPSSSAYFAKIGRMETCPPGCYKVALLLQTNLMGWHWMRQNCDGSWSQKNGTDDVTKFEEGSNPNIILDPQFCKTSYNYFCGYYCVGPWTNYGMPSN